MAEDFRGPRLKIARAKEHIVDLKHVLQRFIELQGYKAVADFQTQPGYIVWVAKGSQTFSHEELSPIIGDAIHNLRDSLDLAVSVIMRNAGLSDEHVTFPTANSSNNFQRAIAPGKKGPRFPESLVSVLESRIEPYEGGHGLWLRVLHKLAILDKHRLIVPTVFGLDTVHISVEGNGEIPMRFWQGPVPIEDGRQLARLVASEWPDIKVDQEARVTLSIEFDRRCGRLWRWTIEEGLYRLLNATEDAIENLESCL